MAKNDATRGEAEASAALAGMLSLAKLLYLEGKIDDRTFGTVVEDAAHGVGLGKAADAVASEIRRSAKRLDVI